MANEQVRKPRWPTLDEQLKESNVKKDSALEKLIKDNQNFAMLRPEEATDKLRIPPWLRVHFRKAHPELTFKPGDPTGGYPLALRGSLSLDDPEPGFETPGQSQSLTDAPGGEHGDQRSNLRRQRRFAPRVRHPVQLQQHQRDHLRLDQARRATSRCRSRPTAAPRGRNRACRASRATRARAIRRSTGPRTARPGRSRSASRRPTPLSSCERSSRSIRAPRGRSTPTWTAARARWTSRRSGSITTPARRIRDNMYLIWHNGSPRLRVQARGTGRHVERAAAGERLGDDGHGHRRRHQDERRTATSSRSGPTAAAGISSSRSPPTAASRSAARSRSPRRAARFRSDVPAQHGRLVLIYLSGGACRTATEDVVFACWMDLAGGSDCDSSGDAPGQRRHLRLQDQNLLLALDRRRRDVGDRRSSSATRTRRTTRSSQRLAVDESDRRADGRLLRHDRRFRAA